MKFLHIFKKISEALLPYFFAPDKQQQFQGTQA
jgi:hypothetical protein